MRIDILTALPQLLESPFNHSMLKRAQDKKLVEIHLHNLRDYSDDKHKRVDDYMYGGGAGMVMRIEPIANAIESLCKTINYDEIIYTSPDGEPFNQSLANSLSLKCNILILCGHYKGVDQRVRDLFITREISIGDYVLTGGELAAAVITDSVVRLLPGVLSDESSALLDSFQDNLLASPVYTRPPEFRGLRVPDILLSGHEENIDNWRLQQSLERTQKLRPDILNKD